MENVGKVKRKLGSKLWKSDAYDKKDEWKEKEGSGYEVVGFHEFWAGNGQEKRASS